MAMLVRAPSRVVVNPEMESRRWDGFEPRDDDIIIASYPKCGTTWTQRIVDLLVFQSPDVRPCGEISPWLESTIFCTNERALATLRAQTHRRYVKTHLPLDALPLWDTVKYIHVSRDGRDACHSWKNHLDGFSLERAQRITTSPEAHDATASHASPAPPKKLFPSHSDQRDFLLAWMSNIERVQEDSPNGLLDYFGFEATYWRERERANLLLVHYRDLKENRANEMRRISDFLEIDTPERLMPTLVEAASFDSMKQAGDALFPTLSGAFDNGATRFFHQGKDGCWQEYMTAEDIGRYESIASKRIPPDLAAWLANGRLGAGDPKRSQM